MNLGKRTITVKTVSQAEASRRIADSVSRRAYEIFESRGSVPGDDHEHWLLAESELLRPLCCGILETEDKVYVVTDASVFGAGEVEVCVEPRRLIVMGQTNRVKELQSTSSESREGKPTYRICSLPVEVDPTEIGTKLNGSVLEIAMRKVAAGVERAGFARAA